MRLEACGNMYASGHKRLLLRALLTETLPYEVPIIFSNSRLFLGSCWDITSPSLQVAFSKIRAKPPRFTKPYLYRIQKTEQSQTTLSIVHPLVQQEMAVFYDQYAATILASCARSPVTLRAPLSVSAKFVEELTSSDPSPDNEGTVDIAVGPGGEVAPIIGSYFAYARYSLIGRFYESVEYIRLEKRFKALRRLDVSRCFASIYTHSIAWAIKGKEFAKRHISVYSFEGAFDALMQKANWGETNGIVVGPELSRIFAEVIFQSVDAELVRELESAGLVRGWDYELRRYVDDYFVYGNSVERLDEIEVALRSLLSMYGLHLNGEKTQDLSRPFVTPLTLARRELRREFREISRILRDLPTCEDPKEYRWRARDFREIVEGLRLLVAAHGVHMHAVSGWLLGSTKTAVSRVTDLLAAEPRCDEGTENELTGVLQALLELAFYICYLDTRVRPTYALAQVLDTVFSRLSVLRAHNADQIRHVVNEELAGIVRRTAASQNSASGLRRESIELYNFLIMGAHYLGSDFLDAAHVRESVLGICSGADLTYFGFITARFCLVRGSGYASALSQLETAVELRLSTLSRHDVASDSESYLLLCDFLSAGDIDESRRRSVFDAIFGGALSKNDMLILSRYIGFVDWSGERVRHLLERKELRPVYE